MVWSLLYGLTRNTLGVMLLRVRSDTAKDIEIVVLRHQLSVLRRQVTAPPFSPPIGYYWPLSHGCCREPAGAHSW